MDLVRVLKPLLLPEGGEERGGVVWEVYCLAQGVAFRAFAEILVDPKTDCLSVGAAALPVAAFLYS